MKKTTKRLSAFLLACVMSIGLCPTSLAAGDTQEENTESAGGTTVADWKFEKNCTTGSIADATLNVLDASGNNNDLKMQLYTNSQPTTDVNAANWEDYLSFSENSMTGTGGSMVFSGDNGSVQSKTGADLITVDTAPINKETFENGYTLEYLYYFPKDWTTADQWMSLMARQGSSSSISEPQQGTMFTSISNCKEVQFNTAPAADDHTMRDSAWSVTMDQGGVWYHIAVVSDGHEISTYINGCEAFRDYVSDDMKGMYADPDDGRFRIGSSWWKEGSQTLDKFLQGSLQEVRISNAALQQNDWLISDPTKYAGNFGSNEPYKLKHSDNYNFVLLPDTQNTVEYRPDVMNTAIDELIDTADDLNVKAVVHLGDIVDDVTNEQYKNARDAFYRIPEAGIKLLAQLGNHDGWGSGIMNSYNGFSGKSSAWTSRTNWYLHFSPNGDKYSSYMFVQAGSYNYLIVSVSAIGGSTKWNPADEAWLREVLNKYPNCPTIVTTHNMQSCSATAPDAIELSSDGKKIWDIVKDYDQVFMLVGGHHHGAGVETLTNTNGKPVLSVLTDYQFGYNGGNGWFRYLEFDEHDNKVYYSSYSPYAASLSADEKSFFDVNFLTGNSGNQGELELNFKERFAGMERSEQSATAGQWMRGEYHTHTGQSKDATESFMSLKNVLGTAFRNPSVLTGNQNSAAKTDNITSGSGFDFLMLADHLRKSKNNTDGSAGAYDIAFYKAVQLQIRDMEEMQITGQYTDKLMYSGFEWDMPGLDHASVGLLNADSDTIPVQGIHQFEWLYGSQKDGDDTSLFNNTANSGDYYDEQTRWGERKNASGSNGSVDTAVEAAEWVKNNYPDSFILPNHPSRHNGGSGQVTIEALQAVIVCKILLIQRTRSADVRRTHTNDAGADDLLIVFTAGCLAYHNIRHFRMDILAAKTAGMYQRQQLAAMRILCPAVYDQLVAVQRNVLVKLLERAERQNGAALLQPVAHNQRFVGNGNRDDDIRISAGFLVRCTGRYLHAELSVHLLRIFLRSTRTNIGNADFLNRRHFGNHRTSIHFALYTRTDDREHLAVLACQIAGSNACRSAGANIGDVAAVHDGKNFAGACFVQQNDAADIGNALAAVIIETPYPLYTGNIQITADVGRHCVVGAAVRRPVIALAGIQRDLCRHEHLSFAVSAIGLFDKSNRFVHSQNFLNLLFGNQLNVIHDIILLYIL